MRTTIVVVLDSLRRDHLGVYNPEIRCTPHIDRIAQEAAVFDDVVAQAPWTLPSTASIFTGQYPWEHHATNAKAHLETDRETLAETFSDHGYLTGLITPNIWITPHKGMTDGFDSVENFLGVGQHSLPTTLYRAGSKYLERVGGSLRRPIVGTLNRLFDSMGVDTACRSRATVDAATSFIETNADDRFFLFVNLMEPHEPYRPPQEYLDRHGVEDLRGVPDDTATFFDGRRDYEELRKAYRASVDYTDDLVGRLDRAVTEHGLDDAAMVVLGDHGQALGEGNVFGHQFTVRDEVVRVPLLVRTPEVSATRRDQLVELRELYRYLPSLAGFGAYDPGVSVAVGGYEFPEVFKRYISTEEMDRYYRKFRYLRTSTAKLRKTEQADGAVSYTRTALTSGAARPIDHEEKRRLDQLGAGETEGGRVPNDDHPAIEARLEALGYR